MTTSEILSLISPITEYEPKDRIIAQLIKQEIREVEEVLGSPVDDDVLEHEREALDKWRKALAIIESI